MMPQFRESPSLEEREELKAFGLEDCEIDQPYLPMDLPQEKIPFLVFKTNIECPICFKVLSEPLISKLCAHTFCKECIERHMEQSEYKDCPKCHFPIESSSNLQTANFAVNILNKLYKNLGVEQGRSENIENPRKRKKCENETKFEFVLINDPLDSDIYPISQNYLSIGDSSKIGIICKIINSMLPENSAKAEKLYIYDETKSLLVLNKENSIRELAEICQKLARWDVFYSSL